MSAERLSLGPGRPKPHPILDSAKVVGPPVHPDRGRPYVGRGGMSTQSHHSVTNFERAWPCNHSAVDGIHGP
jgi:hypothetical protein